MTGDANPQGAGTAPETPTTAHTAVYTPDRHALHGDARLSSPVFPRNSPPLIATLAPWLSGMRGTVVEVGCGTGQHAAAFQLAFPALDWHATDPFPPHRASADGWRETLGLMPRPAIDLDAASDWSAIAQLAPLSAVFSANVIHIAPPAVTRGILAGAARHLGPGGLLILYGPFKENGRHSGEGNARFDAGLRAENPKWGLRDIADLAADAAPLGLSMTAQLTMPSNNRLLIFRRQPEG